MAATDDAITTATTAAVGTQSKGVEAITRRASMSVRTALA
jgi:hypothetical protein